VEVVWFVEWSAKEECALVVGVDEKLNYVGFLGL
jgi:hypothetical protein